MSKRKRIVVPGDQQQWVSMLNGPDKGADLISYHKDGTLTVVQLKHLENTSQFHRASVEHIALLRQPSEQNAVRDDLSMPNVAQMLLPFIVSRKLRDNVFGDLAEDFRTYAAQWGRPYALRLLCWDIAGLIVRRFGPAGIVTAILMWFRHKIGW